jgi:methylmalonyl-CoA mutase C-terminal domain/subunit
MMRKIKVVVAKPGLDGHETGSRLIARSLRDAGMEVVYLGARNTPEMIVNTAIQEAADIIGLSILSGIHKEACAEVVKLLKQRSADSICVLVGGIIPRADFPFLKGLGISGIFGPNSDTRDVISLIHELVGSKHDPERGPLYGKG